MHIEVTDTTNTLCRDLDVFVNVVRNIDKHNVSVDSSVVSATRGKSAITYNFKSFTLTTPIDYKVIVKDWKDSRYRRRTPVNNRRALGEWLFYDCALFVFGNCGISVDSRQKRLEIYVNEGMSVYIDGKRIAVK